MINTISKTLGAQEKTQDIKQSPSTKIGTKPDARFSKKRAHRGHRTLHRTLRCTGRCTGCCTGRCTGCSDQQARQQQQRPDTTPNTAPDAECQSPVNISKVLESSFCDWTRPISADRRPVSSRKAGFRPQRLLSQWGL